MDRISTEVIRRLYQTPDTKDIHEVVETDQAVIDNYVGQLNWLEADIMGTA